MKRHVLLLLTSMLPAFLLAQKMCRLTLNDGLAGLSVTSLAEDPSGKMWLTTSNGVSLYNGTTLKNYAIPPTEEGLPTFCHEATLDKRGNVWLATKGGVYRLRRGDDEFRRVATDIRLAECILCDGDRVYVGNPQGLHVIDAKGNVQTVDISAGQVHDNMSVRCLRQTDAALWLSMRTGLVRIDKRTSQPVFYPLFTPSGLSRFDIVGNRLFVGTKNNGLYLLHPATGESQRVDAVSNTINDVRALPDGTVAVATDGSGAYLLDVSREDALPTVVHRLTTENGLLPTDEAYTYLRTADGVDWVGMFQTGLVHSEFRYDLFAPYECGTFSTRGMKISVALADSSKWLVAVHGGLWLIDEESQSNRFFDTGALRAMNIILLYKYAGDYYIGSFDGGLLRLDARTWQLSRLPNCPPLEYATISGMATDSGGRLWVTSSEGLFITDGRTVLRRFTEQNSSLPRSLSNICFDQHGNGWIGYVGGLCRLARGTTALQTDNFPEGFFNRAPRLKLASRGDTIYAWSPTHVYRTNSAMTDFGEVPLPAGILEEKCYEFLPVADGVQYLVTEKGLFRVSGEGTVVRHFSPLTGLTGQITNTASLGTDGRRLWVGTTEGLMMARLAALDRDTVSLVSHAIEADFVVLGTRALSKGEMMQVNDSHTLWNTWHWGSQQLVFKPVRLDYGCHTGGFYEYRTDNRPWTLSPLGEACTINDLSLGRHTLEIRMPGMESTSVRYTIYVRPAVAVYIELGLLLVGLGLFVWWYRWRRNTKLLLTEHKETEEALIAEIRSLPVVEEEKPSTKYAKWRTSDEDLARLFGQMDEYVRANKPYLDKDSKMSDIATAIGCSPSQLSQVFTLYVKEPYYDYINRFRLEEFKRLIAEGRHRQFTITALSEQCGFKKTSFFSTFRKIEGTTPTEWIQKGDVSV